MSAEGGFLEQPDATESRYLLLDGAQCARSPRDLLSGAWAAEVTALFDGAVADGSRDVAPYLVRLREAHLAAEVYVSLRRQLSTENAATWLDSSLAHEELHACLSRRLYTVLPNGKKMLLRAYDGRVLPHLAAVLDPDQTTAIFCVARRWWYLSPEQRWCFVAGEVAAQDRMLGPIALSLPQRRTLQDACYPYSVMAHFADTAPELLEPVAPEERYEYFRDTIAAAERLGLTTGPDMVLFCTMALLEGGDFHAQTHWHERMTQVASGQRTLAEVFDEHYKEEYVDGA